MVWTRGQQASECEFLKESKYICTHAGTSVARNVSIEKGIVARGSDIILKNSVFGGLYITKGRSRVTIKQ
jgi:hypothetical protein